MADMAWCNRFRAASVLEFPVIGKVVGMVGQRYVMVMEEV
jgi:hypothetical protein